MFLRTVTRAAPRSSPLPTAAIRCYRGPMASLSARPQAQTEKKGIAAQQTRAASEHAISNPTLAGIEKRWEAMPPQEQADLWMQLRDRMKVDWHQMTLQEKKAGESFCPWNLFDLWHGRLMLDVYYSVLDCVRPPWPPC